MSRRPSVTLDEGIADELESWSPAVHREAVQRVLESPAVGDGAERLWVRLAEALDELGDDPSTSAIMRQAVEYFLQAVRDAEWTARMEAGYAQIAAESGRDRAVKYVTARAARSSSD